MKLYSGGIAPNPRRVTIFLAEKGIEVETVQIDIAKLEHKGDALKKISARQRLPVLQLDDGTIITETVAICRYFDNIQPDPPLMGVGPKEQAIVEMWQRRVELEFFMPVAMAFRHLHPVAKALEPVQVPQWGEINQALALDAMHVLDGELAQHEFIAGECFSIADITAIAAYQFLKPGRIAVPEDTPHLNHWFDHMMQRTSTKW